MSAAGTRARVELVIVGVLCVAAIVAGAAIWWWAELNPEEHLSDVGYTYTVPAWKVGLGVALIVVGLLGAAAGLWRYAQALAVFRGEAEQRALGAVDSAIEQLDENATDHRGLMRVNRRQMEAYHLLATGQARTSYRNSQIASAAGFALLVLGGIVVVGSSDSTTKIAAAGLTAIGGTLSGYISRTFLGMHDRAISQLNFYFQQPLIDGQVLTAERLADRLSGTERDAMLSETIRSVLSIAQTRTEEAFRSTPQPEEPTSRLPLPLRRRKREPEQKAAPT